ncbi:unnamed protein product [Rotaria socialis]|uniref:Uncharacterized protein n=1 Tax=Rotaria socialis TaxID=392032 RepID=A0A821WXB1_9BILA|nr:unnamed protein product [Rotaria socialis]CAF4935236.1 unnamed protein product [Rotaria socialis]CAF4964246.1 unnamed protein product [Rotaria socialis]
MFLLTVKKNYRQTTGGAMGSSLTLTLANIFMSKCQKNIVEEQTKIDEFYGRLPFLDVQLKNYEEKLFLHYTHEKRFKFFKRDMHCVYQHIFKSAPAIYTKFIVANRNRRQAANELIRKRPTQTFLQNNITQNKLQIKNEEFKNKILLYL